MRGGGGGIYGDDMVLDAAWRFEDAASRFDFGIENFDNMATGSCITSSNQTIANSLSRRDTDMQRHSNSTQPQFVQVRGRLKHQAGAPGRHSSLLSFPPHTHLPLFASPKQIDLAHIERDDSREFLTERISGVSGAAKLIFLDVDGVLNTSEQVREKRRTSEAKAKESSSRLLHTAGSQFPSSP